jgi:hypothetical protein
VSEDADEVRKEFGDAVNMTRGELERWLDTDESRSVGAKEGSGEAVGHRSGRRIVAILDKKKADLTDDDLSHMGTVVGYVRRHLAQRPEKEDLETSRWRYSLMNWGHDPLKT